MREVPECLNRRYRALDELVQELSSSLSHRRELEGDCSHMTTDDPGIELMCKFWNILKEDPECDLTQAVEDRMRVNTKGSSIIPRPPITCYMASNTSRKGANLSDKVKSGCCTSNPQPSPKDRDSCCGSKSPTPSAAGADALPLSKVLCNLKEAASFDKKCNARVNELIRTQKELQEQITHLEHREKEGTNLLKQADCMWSCMEESYKKKVAESIQRQQDLMKQLKEIEKSATKWRKNKKEVESQVYSIHKCHQEIIDKIHQKTNDIKCMDMEIQGFKKKIESNKKEIANASKLTTNKKQASTAKINGIAAQVALLQKSAAEAAKFRYSKEGEGSTYIKEAREDLQKLCRVLLQKKLENEDLRAEKDALLLEIDLLKQTCDQCKDRCKNKQVSINDEIKEVEKSIATYKVKCIRCHECTDTIDIRKFCTDCPKCAEERDCLYEGDHCNPDSAMDCVCMSVKQKFLDNVFDNMYTVLERQARTGPGKAVADQVLDCLKRSRNGKLNDDTRRLLQDFILTTVKKNLNLTIVGGAVKTRCEMDPETYQQLMTCLKRVKVQRPPKADKGTNAKKEPCRRWGAASECNCPKGPKECICTKKAPPPPQDPSPCPPKDKEDAGEEVKCPFKGSASCGPDCAMHAVPSLVGTEIAAWRPDPCQGQSCPFSKNMRAAQCVLGPESLVSLPPSNKAPYDPDKEMYDDVVTCKCGKASSRPCSCRSSRRSRPREKIIEEVFGRYTDVTPIEKVTYLDDRGESQEINTKHVKARIVKICDKSTCSLLCDQRVDNISQKKLTDQEESTLYGETSSKIKHTEQNKIEIDDESTDMKLTKTPSGNLAVEIDEKIIDLIEQKTEENPNIIVFLKDTKSGHFIVKFHDSEDVSDELHRITIARTPSGAKLLEVHTNFIQTLRSLDTPEYELPAEPDIKSTPKECKELQSQNIKSTENTNEGKHAKNLSVGTKAVSIINTIKDDQSENCEEEDKRVTVTINAKFSGLSDIPGSLNMEMIHKDDLFKVKVRGIDNAITSPPVVLRTTPSRNYEVVVDKEFEKRYMNIIRDSFSDENMVYGVSLLTTDSCNYLIDLNDHHPEDKVENCQKAVVMRSASGHLKLAVNGVDLNALPVRSTGKPSENVLGELMKKIDPCKDRRNENVKRHKITISKATSDSCLYEKVKIKVDGMILFSEPSAVLKKTSSGQLAVVLNKESKKAFINNLKNYISNKPHGLIPIKRTESGEIVIDLNNDIETKSRYGSLKITSSGSIYILVNETVIQEMIERETECNIPESKSIHLIDRNIDPADKSVTTTCHGKPEECSCDVTQCVCKRLQIVDDESVAILLPQNCSIEWQNTEINMDTSNLCGQSSSTNCYNNKITSSEKAPHIVIKPCNCRPKQETKKKNVKQCYYIVETICPFHKNRYDLLSNELLEITGPCDKPSEGIVKEKKLVGVAKEPDGIHEPQGNNATYNSVNESLPKINTSWDSLEYLPPQLPAFLKDINYRQNK